MSIFKLNRGDFDIFSITTNPIRTYVSSSTRGVTGSLNIFARRSSMEKDLDVNTSFIDISHNEKSLAGTLDNLTKVAKKFRSDGTFASTDTFRLNKMLESYLSDVNEKSISQRKQRRLDVFRSVPSFNYTVDTGRKLMIKNSLNSYYRDVFPHANWAYSNYNVLNFFTASSVPTSSVLLYPNVDEPATNFHEGYVSGTYALSGSFSFDFCINPRYAQSQPDTTFKAGTLFHLSSSYAVSLISGSAKDENGRTSHYRIQLQLSHSADVLPSLALNGIKPNDLTFLSDDNVIARNNWSRVIIRWGTNLVNNGTGSFNVNGVDRGLFVIPSGTINLFTMNQPPKVLCIGNYYEGSDDAKQFFAYDPATRDGLEVLDDTTGIETPVSFSFNHPLNAEVHDLMIKRYYMNDDDIVNSASMGPVEIPRDKFAFFVPPFFVEESPFRQFIEGHGGIPQTPFFEIDGTTNDPFNVAMSFGVGGHYINLENFVRDFASNVFPRLHHLTGTTIASSTEFKSANQFLYEQPFVVKRNLTILPSDDGTHVPNFELLRDESPNSKFINDLGIEDLSLINMSEMMNTSSLLFGTDFGNETKSIDEANQFVNDLIGFTPEQPGIAAGSAFRNYIRRIDASVLSGTFDAGIQTGAPLTIYNRTRDASSNQVTMFDLSNLFYGNRIEKETFTLIDRNLSGSNDVIKITLKDDGQGNLYRADSLTTPAKWNSCGSIYPYEGILVIKSPHLFFFGQNDYEMSFRGEQNVHVLKVDALAPANLLNSSSNPNYVTVNPSAHPNDPDTEFVYISQINFHDDNLNVVAKAQLAQPLMKRLGDKFIIRVKWDF